MESLSTVGTVVRTILALIFGSPTPPAAPANAVPLQQYLDQHPIAYVELDKRELHATVESIPEVRKALFMQGERRTLYADAVKQTSAQLGIEAKDLNAALSGIRRVGFWWLGFGEDEENLRLFLLIDHANPEPVLDALIPAALKQKKPGSRREGFIALPYGDARILGFRSRNGMSIWMTEHKGKIALCTDVMGIQSFLLHSQAMASGAVTAIPAKQARPAILTAQVDGKRLLNDVMTLLDGYDLSEFLMVSAFFDFPAWDALTLAMDKTGIRVTARLAPASMLCDILPPSADKRSLLKSIPDDCGLALAAFPKSPVAVWKHIRSGLALVGKLEGEGDFVAQVLKEMKRETGLDLKTDIIDILAGAGFMVPTLKSERDLERNFVLLADATQAAKAEASIHKLVTRVMPNQAAPMPQQGAKVWTVEEVRMGLAEETVIFASPMQRDGQLFSQTLKQRMSAKTTVASLLSSRHPGATVFAVFNPAILLRGNETGLVTAGLTFKKPVLDLTINYDLAGIARGYIKVAEQDILKAKKQQSMANLKQIARCCGQYLSDYAKYPPEMKNFLPYAHNKAEVFLCPVSGKAYVYRKELSGRMVGSVQNRATTVLAHDARSAHPDGGFVVYLDGHVVFLDKAEFTRLLATQP